jgi:hypothetical protein
VERRRGRLGKFRDRATLLTIVLVGLGFVVFVALWSIRAPRELSCEYLCGGAQSHCAFTDHSICLASCGTRDLECRERCTARRDSCPVHCNQIRTLRCEAELEGLYGCLILRCADPERDVWRACDQALRKYDACVTRAERTEPLPRQPAR